MEHVVVGLEDEALGKVAVDWVIERAESKAVAVKLVAELDVTDSNPDAMKDLLASESHRIQNAVHGTPVQILLAHRPLLHEMLEQSETADLVVIGSHPHPDIRKTRTPSFPVSLAARSRCTVVIVPDDWHAGAGMVVVGVDDTVESYETASFAAREAAEVGRMLEIVHTWEPWTDPDPRPHRVEHEHVLADMVERIRSEYPDLGVEGVLREAVAHDGVLASSRGAHLVVLGTHGLGRETGLVLGAIHQELMIRGHVALCIVPLA